MLQSMTCMNKVLHQEDLTFLEGMDTPLCFMSPKFDTLYYDQVMQVEDKEKLKEAMLKDVATQCGPCTEKDASLQAKYISTRQD